MGQQLMAVVVEGTRQRTYLTPTEEHLAAPEKASPAWAPEAELQGKAAENVPLYGMRSVADIFTQRQLVALTTFSDLIADVRDKVYTDAKDADLRDDGISLNNRGAGAQAYADAVALISLSSSTR